MLIRPSKKTGKVVWEENALELVFIGKKWLDMLFKSQIDVE